MYINFKLQIEKSFDIRKTFFRICFGK